MIAVRIGARKLPSAGPLRGGRCGRAMYALRGCHHRGTASSPRLTRGEGRSTPNKLQGPSSEWLPNSFGRRGLVLGPRGRGIEPNLRGGDHVEGPSGRAAQACFELVKSRRVVLACASQFWLGPKSQPRLACCVFIAHTLQDRSDKTSNTVGRGLLSRLSSARLRAAPPVSNPGTLPWPSGAFFRDQRAASGRVRLYRSLFGAYTTWPIGLPRARVLVDCGLLMDLECLIALCSCALHDLRRRRKLGTGNHAFSSLIIEHRPLRNFATCDSRTFMLCL